MNKQKYVNENMLKFDNKKNGKVIYEIESLNKVYRL